MTGLLPAAIAAAIVGGVFTERNPYTQPVERGAYVVPYAGAYNLFKDRDPSDRRTAAVFGAEYRFQAWDFYGLRPVLGASVTHRGDLYGYGGLAWDVPLIKGKLWFTPGFAAGAFHHGDGRDLGGLLEFRSSAELSYQFNSGHRLGLGIAHLSNGNIYRDNPGTEEVYVNYAIPIGSLF